ncbi:MAG: DEAD/DEAH box helicase [Acidobacteria bacterium]|nr:DEAD/DEAH box helicase [Acidobacteriota bacterium]
MDKLETVLEQIRRFAQRNGSLAAWKVLPASDGEFADIPESLHPRLQSALRASGVHRLYSHQAAAIAAVNEGRHVVLVTPTASGKTLCYNIPVLQRCLEDPATRALYLFPTKALSQDQMAGVQTLIDSIGGGVRTHTYDGDTPGDARRAIRDMGQIVITNPDMLHQAILPHHPKWQKLFKNLRYVVVDEIHTYRGVFGSHVANLFRRLKRIAAFYGVQPQFICCSATIANPGELAENLLEEKVTVVDRNGAPSGKKIFMMYNPPVVNPDLGIRQSYLTAARKLAVLLLQHKVPSIVFAISRLNVEVLVKYLKDAVEKKFRDKGLVRGYRGGYLPLVRREIEKGLRDGEILGVVSTNALELGVDIGALTACIIAGYPGTIASTWQQAGRAGRKQGLSLIVLVGRSFPLDQFIMQNPDYFFGQSPEHALINPDNLLIMLSHLKCAAFELPFRDGEAFGTQEVGELLEFLEEHEVLHHSQGRWHWMNQAYPATEISLRDIAEENFVVLDADDNCHAIAEVDFESAPEIIHEDAIYMCESRQYWVEKLDYDARKAYVRPTTVDFYTEAIVYSSVRVLDEFQQEPRRHVLREHGEVHVVKNYAGFKKIRFYTLENLGFGDIHLPQHDLHTTAFWITGRPESLSHLPYTRLELIDGFLGAAYALHNVATLLLMCAFRDIGRSVGDRYARWFAVATHQGRGLYTADGRLESGEIEIMDRFEPTLFLYDSYPGGVGLSEELWEKHYLLLARTRDLILVCPCRHGCPSCVGPVNDSASRTKPAAMDILNLFLAT